MGAIPPERSGDWVAGVAEIVSRLEQVVVSLLNRRHASVS
jgi:hypothetical protein